MLFTPASKLYFGIATLAVAAFVIVAIDAGWNPMATVVLGVLAGAAIHLGSSVIAVRDAEWLPSAVAQSSADAEGVSPVGDEVPLSAWPLIGAFGLGALLIGLIVDQLLFLLGLVVLVATMIEWMVQAWAERASASAGFNAAVRARTMHPLEYPVLAVLVAGFIAVGLSRVLLAASKIGSIVVFSAIAIVVFVLGIALALRPQVSRSVMTGIVALFGVAVLASGIAAAAIGPREIKHHDHAGVSEDVSDTSAVLATVALDNGELVLTGPGVQQAEGGSVLVIPRALTVTLVFRHVDTGVHRLLVRDEEQTYAASGDLEEGQAQAVTFQLPRSGEYELVSEGTQDEQLATIRVP